MCICIALYLQIAFPFFKPVNTQHKNIVIRKTGIGSQIFDFANENAATYGFFVIIFSIVSGFIAAALFRRSK